MAFAAAYLEHFDLAAQLYGAMTGLRQWIGYPAALHEQTTLNALDTLLRQNLDASDFLQNFQEGQALDMMQSLELAEAVMNICRI